MAKKANLLGRRFGKLIVTNLHHLGKKNSRYWQLLCDCGGRTIVSTADLNSGKVNSCGCLKVIKLRKRNTTHGQSKTRLYRIWRGMIDRCYNINTKSYKNYGERGIAICDIWRTNFVTFYKWATQNGYKETLTIERVDNDGNYHPDNCTWIPKAEQMKNTRPRVLLPPRNTLGRFVTS